MHRTQRMQRKQKKRRSKWKTNAKKWKKAETAKKAKVHRMQRLQRMRMLPTLPKLPRLKYWDISKRSKFGTVLNRRWVFWKKFDSRQTQWRQQKRWRISIKRYFVLKKFSALVLKFLWQKKQKTLNVGKTKKNDQEKKFRQTSVFRFSVPFLRNEKAQNTPVVAEFIACFPPYWICAKVLALSQHKHPNVWLYPPQLRSHLA